MILLNTNINTRKNEPKEITGRSEPPPNTLDTSIGSGQGPCIQDGDGL